MLPRAALRTVARRPRARPFSTTSAPSTWSGPHSLAGLPIDIAPEVAQAKAEGRAIVALESTLVTHGLPPPHSASLPKECEAILRAQVVTPATIAILNGRIKVGLEEQDLDYLAERGWEARKDKAVAEKMWKVGRRELAAAVVKRLDGGTTVSGTMAVAHLAGIKIFSTGGIGGVHRGAETSFDISSDLISLSDTPVAVVCAGSKSILDIGLTLEYLEAHAVPVAVYKTADREWPAFYTAKSGFKAPMNLESAREVAETIVMTDRLGLPSSLLLGNPIPEEYHAVGEELQRAVDQAVAESVENGMAKSGKQVTPWLLGRVAELSQGKSLESNKALIRNNVKVGGEVALEYARLLQESSTRTTSSFMPSSAPLPPAASPAPIAPSAPSAIEGPVTPAWLVVAGVLAVDITMQPASSSPLQTTAPGTVSLTLGGVAGNVAGAANSLLSGFGKDEVLLVAPVADDLLGGVTKSGLRERGLRDDGLISTTSGETATCGILLDEKGDLVGGIADMGIATELSGKKIVERIQSASPAVVCFDGNLSQDAIADVVTHCLERSIPTFFEPTSNAKALQLLHAIEKHPHLASVLPATSSYVSFAAPNIQELTHLYQHIAFSDHPLYNSAPWFDHITVPAHELSLRLPKWVIDEGVAQMATRLISTSLFGTLFVKSGVRGVLVVQRVSGVDNVAAWSSLPSHKGTVVVRSTRPTDAVILRHHPALELDERQIGTVTGAGDNLAGAILAGLVRGWRPSLPHELDNLVDLGQSAAVATLQSKEAVGDLSDLHTWLP